MGLILWLLAFIYFLPFFMHTCNFRVMTELGMKGRYIFEETGKPIANAEVTYEGFDFKKSTVTNKNGEFEFKPVIIMNVTPYPFSHPTICADVSIRGSRYSSKCELISSINKAMFDIGTVAVPTKDFKEGGFFDRK